MLQVLKDTVPENTPCGNCGEPLGADEIWIAIGFDELHEVPEEIRSGHFNYIICPRCGYGAFLWPGFICIDRGHQRIVSALIEVEPLAHFEGVLASSLERAIAHGIDVGDLTLDGRHASVGNYQHLIELLTEPEENFLIDVEAWAQFRERAALPDFHVRAQRLFEQAEAAGRIALIFRGREDSRAFKEVLAAEAERRAAAMSPDDPRHAVALKTAEVIRTSVIKHRHSDPAGELDPELERFQAGTERVRELAIKLPAPPLLRFLEALVDAGPRKLADPIWQELVDTVFELADLDLRFDSEERQPELEDHGRVSRFLDAMEFRAGPDMVRLVDGTLLSLEGAVLAAAAGNPSLILLLHEKLYVAVLQGVLDTAKILDSVSLFVEIAIRTGRPEALFAAVSIAKLSLERRYDDTDSAALVGAVALRVMCRSWARRGGFAMQDGLMTTIAIAWEGLGRFAARGGHHDVQAWCARTAETIFSCSTHDEGLLTARVDASEALHERGRLDDASLEALEAEIRSAIAKATGHSKYDWLLRRVLMIRARREFLGTMRDTALVMAMMPPDPETDSVVVEGNKIAVIADGRLVRMEDQAKAPPQRHFGKLLEVPWEVDRVVLDCNGQFWAPDRDPPIGVIEYFCRNQDGATPYVFIVNFVGCPWIDTFAEILYLDESAEDKGRWFNTAGIFLECLTALPDPGLTRYFIQLFRVLGPLVDRDPSQEIWFDISDAYVRIQQRHLAGGELAAPDIVALADGIDRRITGDPRLALRKEGHHVGGLLDIVASVFEAVGKFDRAFEMQIAAAQLALAHDATKPIDLLKETHQHIERPLYRAARALAQLLEIDPSVSTRCVELGELCKVQSQQLFGVVRGDPTPPSDDSTEEVLSRLQIRLAQLGDYLPRGSAVLHFSLLHTSKVNEGYWLSALLRPGDAAPADCRRLPFFPLYDHCAAVEELMEASMASLAGQSLGEAASVLSPGLETLETALGELAALLITQPLVDLIEEGEIDRLVIVPEAYLCDLPWSALLLCHPAARKNPERWAEISVDLLPCLAVLRTAPRRRIALDESAAPQFGAMFAAVVPWRSGLARIYGVETRLNAAVQAMGLDRPLETESQATVQRFIEGLLENEVFLYFGHGEVGENGATLILRDGLIGSHEVSAVQRLETRIAIVMACSGTDSDPHSLGREFSGVHMAMVKGGARCVVGSSKPMLAAVATRVVETLLASLGDGASVGRALSISRNSIRADARLAHPIFWGYLTCFGDGATVWNTRG